MKRNIFCLYAEDAGLFDRKDCHIFGNYLKKYKIGTERRCHVIDDQSNIAMVEAGLGISIMPQMLLRDCKAAVKVYPIEPEEYRVVGLAVQRPASMAPAVEQMFHHIVDYCRQLELPL